MGLLGVLAFVVGVLISILLWVGIIWAFAILWTALVGYGVLGIAVFLIFLVVILPYTILAFILAVIPAIIGLAIVDD